MRLKCWEKEEKKSLNEFSIKNSLYEEQKTITDGVNDMMC